MQPDRTAELTRLLRRRILVLDGAMGTQIQQCRLSEADFRGQFHDHGHELRGDNDLLALTKPDVVRRILAGEREAVAGEDALGDSGVQRQRLGARKRIDPQSLRFGRHRRQWMKLEKKKSANGKQAGHESQGTRIGPC